ncbi:5035_t:CDS:2 [Gigaspora margarita]|uniref:5035_t:CDS:1 n=1 Tax=Gigaspora margarita TaxID=4874 RepID=A0ABN7UHB4_GIGMA|nr:5035_t:CDS:2 [Gigaspora margarita]
MTVYARELEDCHDRNVRGWGTFDGKKTPKDICSKARRNPTANKQESEEKMKSSVEKDSRKKSSVEKDSRKKSRKTGTARKKDTSISHAR